MQLAVSKSLMSEMLAHLQSHLPDESCGLLGGAEGRALKVYPVENELHNPYAYRMESHAQIKAMIDIEEHGWDVLAIFHSHPGGRPAPSMSDVRQAYYPDSLYIIAAPDGAGGMAFAAYEIVDGEVREAVLMVEDETSQ